RDLTAPRTAEVIDEDATQQAQQSAKEGLMPVFKKDESHDEESLGALHKILLQIPALQKGGYGPLGVGLTPAETIYVLEADDASFQRMMPASPGGQLSPEESVIRAKLIRKPHQMSQLIFATIFNQRRLLENKNASQEEKIIAVATPPAELPQLSEL